MRDKNMRNNYKSNQLTVYNLFIIHQIFINRVKGMFLKKKNFNNFLCFFILKSSDLMLFG